MIGCLILLICVKKALQTTDSPKNADLIAAALSYLVDYLEKYREDRATKISALFDSLIDPFLCSSEGQLALERMVLSKLLSSSIHSETNSQSFRRIASNNLSYLPTVMSTANNDGYFRLIGAYLRFCQLVAVRLKTTAERENLTTLGRLLANDYIKSYFRMFIKNCLNDTVKEVLLNRQENLFVYHSIKLIFHVYNLEVFQVYG